MLQRAMPDELGIMGYLVDFSKLAELRARTDRDLAMILSSELDRAIILANLAGSEHSVFHSEAEAAYRRAKKLLSRTSAQDIRELAEVEAKLKELRMALDLAAGAMDREWQPACC